MSDQLFSKMCVSEQLMRYFLVGLSLNILGYVLYLIITYFGVGHILSMTLLYISGVVAGYFGHKTWTFTHQGTFFKSSMRYILAHIIGYNLALSIMYILVDVIGFAHQWVYAVTVLAVAIVLFLLFKYLVFPLDN